MTLHKNTYTCNKRRLLVGCVMLVFALALSPILAAGDNEQFSELLSENDYYRHEVIQKESGVYEHGGTLYVHSRINVVNKHENTEEQQFVAKWEEMRAKTKAMLETSVLLKKWAADYTEQARNNPEPIPPGILYAKKVVESVEPDWQFSDWEIHLTPRVLAAQMEKEYYIYALSVDKQRVVEAIPEEYSMVCPPDKLFQVLERLPRGKTEQSLNAFYKRCGAIDIIGDVVDMPSEIKEEYEKFNLELKRFALNSPFMIALREEAKRVSEPQVKEEKKVTTNPQGTVRAEEVRIITTYTTPKMQNLLLALGEEENKEFGRLDSGKEAITLLRKKRKAEYKEQKLKEALCDNPGDKELWNYYGRLLEARGETMVAVICYRIALRLDRHFVFPMVNLANAYQILGYDKLAYGLATAARGVAQDKWIVDESEKILLKEK